MSKEPIEDLISYRLDRAKESLAEAQLLAANGHWNTSVSRLYYACFYAVNALLIKNGKSSVKHSGIKSIFNKDYVHPGIISTDISIIYNELFILRQESDYEDFFAAEEEIVKPMFEQVENFIETLESLLG